MNAAKELSSPNGDRRTVTSSEHPVVGGEEVNVDHPPGGAGAASKDTGGIVELHLLEVLQIDEKRGLAKRPCWPTASRRQVSSGGTRERLPLTSVRHYGRLF